MLFHCTPMGPGSETGTVFCAVILGMLGWGSFLGHQREAEGAGGEETGIPKYQTNLCELWEGRGGGASPKDVFH